MRFRRFLALLLLPSLMLAVASSQPPKDGKEKAPPKFEPGRIFPPPVRRALELTEEQAKKIEAVEKDAYAKLLEVLNDDQKKILVEQALRGAPKEKGIPSKTSDLPKPELPPGPRVVTPIGLRFLRLKVPLQGRTSPFAEEYTTTGDVTESLLGDYQKEHQGRGIRFLSAESEKPDREVKGTATWKVMESKPELSRWYRFRAEILVQDGFQVPKGDVYLEVEFFNDKGSLDRIQKSVWERIQRDRKDLADPATNRNLGGATWRHVTLDFRTPFPDATTFGLTVGFKGGKGTKTNSELWIREIEIARIADPKEFVPPPKSAVKDPPALKSLVKIGGRWYYDPRGDKGELPKQFDHTNADRLYYLTDRLEAPFAGNLSGWLRRGYLDLEGKVVEKDQYLPDAVTLTFTNQHLVMRSRNLPNHPTGVFPDRLRFHDGNPNPIQEKNHTWYIPLEPKENPKHIAMNAKNENQALPVGHLGVMVNGVVFNNPYDESNEIEAIWRLDRCCGHPSPTRDYHYHKYPVCTNTAWNDDGESHSPLIGFAFDGFPVYGPYESAGEMAKDSKKNPLNEFNLHHDEARGFHYHVTPGKTPHIIGGYWGEVDPRNRGKKGKK